MSRRKRRSELPARQLLLFFAVSVVLALSFPASRGSATEDFARETGRACVGCHLDPSGGGTLNAAGVAFLEGRAYVTPDDVKTLAPDVFRHRILLTYEAEAEGVPVDEVTRRILARVEVP